ncbi:MAG: hydrolase 1, exosortase A system-associated [Gammaproteobacteria bacterium]|nr:hydrolase 1, exosortase A system-associated [Gammaproteobacteria bacterium]
MKFLNSLSRQQKLFVVINMESIEIPLVVNCDGRRLITITHKPESMISTGVVLIVGGPQYRVGSHRQFVLLARKLAENGIPVLRFDYRSMGDSEGNKIQFDQIETDLAVAIETFFSNMDGLSKIVLWGLCDAASSALFYGYKDERIKGMVLLNPWVRTEQGEARTYIKHYYLKRIFNTDFWKKVIKGEWNIKESLSGFLSLFGKLWKHDRSGKENSEQYNTSLPERMLSGLEKFSGGILLILSGQDYVADEFREVVASSEKWRNALGSSRVTTHTIQDANHTFSSGVWRKNVEDLTTEWIRRLDKYDEQ